MITIIEYLEAIRQYAKDIHYRSKGEGFYGTHLLMDRVADGLSDKIDAIKEVCYMGAAKEVPLSTEILRVAVAYIPDYKSTDSDNLWALCDLIQAALNHIKKLLPEMGPAESNLIGGISEDLQLKLGLVAHQAKNN